MLLLTAKCVKNSRILGGVFWTFKKNVLKQTWNFLNTKFHAQWKDWEFSYQVIKILVLFFPLSCFNLILKQCERP